MYLLPSKICRIFLFRLKSSSFPTNQESISSGSEQHMVANVDNGSQFFRMKKEIIELHYKVVLLEDLLIKKKVHEHIAYEDALYEKIKAVEKMVRHDKAKLQEHKVVMKLSCKSQVWVRLFRYHFSCSGRVWVTIFGSLLGNYHRVTFGFFRFCYYECFECRVLGLVYVGFDFIRFGLFQVLGYLTSSLTQGKNL